tara:strand:+ start:539 stop:649 length:111 start_codon:yes stop_codon:yes gene_type:complete
MRVQREIREAGRTSQSEEEWEREKLGVRGKKECDCA